MQSLNAVCFDPGITVFPPSIYYELLVLVKTLQTLSYTFSTNLCDHVCMSILLWYQQ